MTQTLEQLSAAATWLRQCHDWMMTNDLDMQCPMETSPEDLAISLEAIIEDMTSLDDRVEVLFAYCCAEAGGRVAYCDCVKKAHGTVFLPDKQVGDHTRTGQLVAVSDDAILNESVSSFLTENNEILRKALMKEQAKCSEALKILDEIEKEGVRNHHTRCYGWWPSLVTFLHNVERD